MRLGEVNLINFRSYRRRTFEFGEKTVVVGENGSGKSNLVEAIYLLATGKSFRAERDEEMIRYGEQFFRIIGQIGPIGQMGVTMSEGRKKFEVNGVARRQIDFVGKLRAVLFSPQDLELVTGSPGGRRRYLDFVISQVDREYHRSLVSYEKGLRQRNRLLEMIRERIGQRNQLFFWDRLLVKNGEYITQKREEYLDKTNKSDGTYTTNYDKSVISEVRLKQYEIEEVAAAATLVGPHRDDFVVGLGGRDVSKYGSRGEQRMAVLWLKKGELAFLEPESERAREPELPVLLLDDIFSELDHRHREEVSRLVDQHCQAGGQVITTSADAHQVPDIKGEVIKLK